MQLCCGEVQRVFAAVPEEVGHISKVKSTLEWERVIASRLIGPDSYLTSWPRLCIGEGVANNFTA